MRRPTRSTLFPYTRSSDLFGVSARNAILQLAHYEHLVEVEGAAWNAELVLRGALDLDERSEEHTSELQSHSDLVCRLLLEKKNPNNTTLHADITTQA